MSKDKLNNLVGMKDFSEGDFTKKAKTTKRTDVAKDILQENTGKMPVEKPKTKDEVKKKDLNNLISLDTYTETELLKTTKKTKRTDVAKDILKEDLDSHDDLNDPRFIAWRDERIDLLQSEYDDYLENDDFEEPKPDFEHWAWREWFYRRNRKDYTAERLNFKRYKK